MSSVLGRYGRGSPLAATALRVHGLRAHVLWDDTRQSQWVWNLGGACSAALAPDEQARILRRAHAPLAATLDRMEAALPHRPLTLHTSVGRCAEADGLRRALEPHLPWSPGHPKSALTLQLDGAAAVRAACSVLSPRSAPRVAVCAESYHGPPPHTLATVRYPVPVDGDPARSRRRLGAFLERHAHELDVLLVEPQWGSSRLGRPWDPELLPWFAAAARGAGVAVAADEVMCGLARHGRGSLFLSTALGLPVDAVVFGKSIAMGLPLAGAAVRPGAVRRAVPLESHTYAGAGRIAIRAAAETVAVLPSHIAGVRAREGVVRSVLETLPPGCKAHGQGLLWGVAHPGTQEQMALACRRCGVWPYSVRGGVMVTPPLSATLPELHQSLSALVDACRLLTAR